jgi:15-cis-phytoene synthase
MKTAIISHLVGSAQYGAISDDSLKDEDNAAWVVTLDSENRQTWLERIEWIRLADRLAENDLMAMGQSTFLPFCQAWQVLQGTGQIPADAAHQSVLHQMQAQWLQPTADAVATLNRQAWNRYLTALNRYHRENLVIDHLNDYTQMLQELAGSFFQVLPDLSESQWSAVYHFGAVDQFYNNLRDMREDAEQGICYVPTAVLDRFGLTRRAILDLSACEHPGYRPMMQFWVEDYLSQLYQKACRFIMMPDLHPAWQILRAWSLNRYRRIERVLRQCDYDYVQFPHHYWPAVQQELFPPPTGSRVMALAAVMQMVAHSQARDWADHLEARWLPLPDQLPESVWWDLLDECEEESHAVAADSFINTFTDIFIISGDRDRRYGPPIPV